MVQKREQGILINSRRRIPDTPHTMLKMAWMFIAIVLLIPSCTDGQRRSLHHPNARALPTADTAGITFRIDVQDDANKTTDKAPLPTPRTNPSTYPFPHYWEECVGSGHAALGLRDDWRNHLKLCHDRLGFKRIRQHGILDDDMGPVVTRGPSGLEYNFTAIDSVYTFLTSIGMSPIVELSWMPAAIASNPKDKVWCYKGGHSTPSTPDLWYSTIHALATHLVATFGSKVVGEWNFEVWNEANCAPCNRASDGHGSSDHLFPACIPGVSNRNPDYPACPSNGNGWSLESYLAVFNATSAALKEVHSDISVGGPSTEQLGWLHELADYAKSNNVAIDFLSTHQYPSDPQVPPTVDGHSDTIKAAVRESSPLPLYITEYSVGSHDDPSAAAGILTYAPRLQGVDGPQIFSYWAFSDVFEERCLSPLPYHNEWGLVNWYGIPKPSFRAFELLHEAGETALPVASIDPTGSPGSYGPFASVDLSNQTAAITVFATTQTVEQTQLATTSHTMAFLTGYAINNTDVLPSRTVPVTVQFCPPSSWSPTINHNALRLPTSARLRRIDMSHANPKAVWVAAGQPAVPNATLLAAMSKASELVDETIDLVPVAALPSCVAATVALSTVDGVVVIDFNMTAASS
eukprot:m.10306 g.10306  ORF g.10306 m.10306 type:complete len:633 (+) comp2734_c0_seq1:3699-5597(+)